MDDAVRIADATVTKRSRDDYDIISSTLFFQTHYRSQTRVFLLNFSRSFSEEAEVDDAVHTALLTMREGFEGEMSEKNIEVLFYSK